MGIGSGAVKRCSDPPPTDRFDAGRFPGLSFGKAGVARGEQRIQRADRRGIGPPVDPLGAEMPLEGDDDLGGRGVIHAGRRDPVAVSGEGLL